MASTQEQSLQNVNLLLRETEQSSYFEKHRRWMDLLARTEQENKAQVLHTFLNYFPFNYQQWIQYAQLTAPHTLDQALKRNPKSFQLWTKHLEMLKDSPIAQEVQKYRKEVEKAIVEVGADVRAGHIYILFFHLLSENYKYEFFKKVFIRALTNLQEIYQLFEQWLSSKTQQQLTVIAAKETKNKITVAPQDLIPFLSRQIKENYNKTLAYRQQRLELESQIKVWYFNGQEEDIEADRPIWRQLIALERANPVVQNLSYAYERMLMAQMHDVELWEEVINYLENQTNKFLKVLNNFRFNHQFFLKFDTDLFFYWCDLQERDNPNQARKLYLQLQKTVSKAQVIIRHIQFEIRQKQWQNAKNLFDSLVTQIQTDPEQIDLLCYTLVEYSNYVIKYYKDYEYPRKLFQSYFEYLPYNHYLFCSYLSFMRNLEYNQGYYDDLMAIIIQGLKKAKKALTEEQLQKVAIKMVKHHLRTVLSSIYLIKLSQRKIMEYEKS